MRTGGEMIFDTAAMAARALGDFDTAAMAARALGDFDTAAMAARALGEDRKSTRLNCSHI